MVTTTDPLDPDGPSEYIVGHLEDALARDPRLCEQGLRVHVPSRGLVVVTGTVSAAARQPTIVEVVRALVPGADVRVDTDVADYAEDGRAETVT